MICSLNIEIDGLQDFLNVLDLKYSISGSSEAWLTSDNADLF